MGHPGSLRQDSVLYILVAAQFQACCLASGKDLICIWWKNEWKNECMNNLLYVKYWEVISKVPYFSKFLSQTSVVVFPTCISIFPVPTVLQIFQSRGLSRTDLPLSLMGSGQVACPSSDHSGVVRIGDSSQSGLRLNSNTPLGVWRK